MSIFTTTARAIQLVNADESNNPFVLADNLAKSATISSTAVLSDGPVTNALSGTTYDYWLPDTSLTFPSATFDLGAPTLVTFLAIAANNIKDLGASVYLFGSNDNVTYTFVASTAATSDVVALRFSATYRYWLFGMDSHPPGASMYIGVLYLGREIIIPRRFYQGFSPVVVPTEVQLQSNVSVGGNLLGSSVIASGSRLSMDFANVEPVFIRSAAFKTFMKSFNRGAGFFTAWRPLKYPEDVYYCWRDGAVITPTNSGPRDLMSFGVAARVYDE
jgi:hypothetical protein